MKNTDLIIADNMIHLDKVYPVRYSMRRQEGTAWDGLPRRTMSV